MINIYFQYPTAISFELISLRRRITRMGLPLRITFKDNDYVYQIIDSKQINHNTTEIELLLNGEKIGIVRDIKLVWKQKDGVQELDSELIQALGRSVSLRLRM
jgi:hypothetical protein